MNLRSIFAIARYTVIEQIRNRLYLIILFFGGMILLASLLVGALAPTYKARVIFDLGLLALELFGLATGIFGAVNLVLQEIESKTIYLIITRPLRRSTYIIGRFLGLIVAVAFTMLFMAALHVLILISNPFAFKVFTDGWSFWGVYPTIVFMSLSKMFITTGIALFFSLFATSSVSALIFTCCFWIAGHFGPEISFMISRSFQAGSARAIARAASHVLPNFQYFNFRDLHAVPHFPGYEFVGWAVLYAVGYAGFFLVLSSYLFNRKEF